MTDPDLTFQDFGDVGDELPKLIDRSRITKYTASINNPINNNALSLHFILRLPSKIAKTEFEQFYILVDYDATNGPVASDVKHEQNIRYQPLNIAGVEPTSYKGDATFNDDRSMTNKKFGIDETLEMRLIPANYYTCTNNCNFCIHFLEI